MSISGKINELSQGLHGFHVHAKGDVRQSKYHKHFFLSKKIVRINITLSILNKGHRMSTEQHTQVNYTNEVISGTLKVWNTAKVSTSLIPLGVSIV